MHVLLTGGSGFLGKHFATFLRDNAVDVLAIGRRPCVVPHVKNITFSHLTTENLGDAIASSGFQPDAIVHLAAAGVHPQDRDHDLLMEINALLPAKIVALGHQLGVKAIVMAGSSAEYADLPMGHRSSERDALQQNKLYGASKAAGGICALSLGNVLNIPVGWMRIFNMYGSGEMPHRLLPSVMRGLLGHQPVAMTEGTQVRDFIYVEDACNALWVALNGLLSGKVQHGAYNVCTGVAHTVKAFALAVAEELHADKDALRFGETPLRPDDAPFVVGDPSCFREASDWVAAYSMEKGIARAIECSRAEQMEVYS